MGGHAGAQYTLDEIYTGIDYPYPTGLGANSVDGTTDGKFNYTMSSDDGMVYRMNRDFSNAVALFSVGTTKVGIGMRRRQSTKKEDAKNSA